MSRADPSRVSRVEIDAAAITDNVDHLVSLVAPARLWAVVKADGYGHGAVTAARAALAGGASGLGVALVSEGEALREAGITAPVMLLSEPPEAATRRVVDAGLEPTVCSPSGVAAATAAAANGSAVALRVHLKVDTGMHRIGVSPSEAVTLACLIAREEQLELASLWTHFAVADDPGDPFTAHQLVRFCEVVDAIRRSGVRVPMVHAANSAGAIAHEAARLDLVRCGISIYGYAPSPALADAGRQLRPALRLVSAVSAIRVIDPGETVSYGRHFTAGRPTIVATVPLGYADGVPRRFGLSGGCVLIGGRRCAVLGTVTMDQLMVDATEVDARTGDEVVLIGHQGAEQISADEWARWLGIITYEVVCGLSARLPRLVTA